uniref:Glycosyl transferase family 11 n=1 Tax=Caenorhabditis tropicalis TaxID=1561998 RepID=A0A1I7TTE1_9PELO
MEKLITPINAQLGLNGQSYEDPLQKFSEYTTLSMMVEGNGFKSFKYFDHLRKEIRLWMLGNAENAQEAKNLLSESLRDNYKVCVHTTQKTHANFTIKAIAKLLAHYTKEKERVMLVLSTTNPGFSRQVFEDFRIKSFDIEKFSLINSPPELQLTFSRIYCDVVFVTFPYSTFGWWMGYLARNENSPVFYFDPEIFPELQGKVDSNDFLPPQWKKITRKMQ